MYRGTTPTFTFTLPIECETLSKLSVANKSSTSDGNITKAENAISNLKTACEGFEEDIGTLQEHTADTKSNPHKITPRAYQGRGLGHRGQGGRRDRAGQQDRAGARCTAPPLTSAA